MLAQEGRWGTTLPRWFCPQTGPTCLPAIFLSSRPGGWLPASLLLLLRLSVVPCGNQQAGPRLGMQLKLVGSACDLLWFCLLLPLTPPPLGTFRPTSLKGHQLPLSMNVHIKHHFVNRMAIVWKQNQSACLDNEVASLGCESVLLLNSKRVPTYQIALSGIVAVSLALRTSSKAFPLLKFFPDSKFPGCILQGCGSHESLFKFRAVSILFIVLYKEFRRSCS